MSLASAVHYSDSVRPGRADSIATAKTRAVTLKCVSTKRLSPERNEAARAFARQIVAAEFGGNESAAAKALKVSQSMLHEFLAGTRGAGMTMLDALATHAGVGVDVVTGRAVVQRPPLNQHPDWPAARADAARLFPDLSGELLDLVGTGTLPWQDPLDGVLVAGLARELASALARNAARKRTNG